MLNPYDVGPDAAYASLITQPKLLPESILYDPLFPQAVIGEDMLWGVKEYVPKHKAMENDEVIVNTRLLLGLLK